MIYNTLLNDPNREKNQEDRRYKWPMKLDAKFFDQPASRRCQLSIVDSDAELLPGSFDLFGGFINRYLE